MEKDFIHYEQALALKELGFNESCLGFYSINNEHFKDGHFHISTENPFSIDIEPIQQQFHCVSAPTFSQAFKWFREKYNIFHEIQIDRTTAPKFCFSIFQYEHFGNYEEIRIGEWYLYRTYEEAELECLIKLIEIVKNK